MAGESFYMQPESDILRAIKQLDAGPYAIPALDNYQLERRYPDLKKFGRLRRSAVDSVRLVHSAVRKRPPSIPGGYVGVHSDLMVEAGSYVNKDTSLNLIVALREARLSVPRKYAVTRPLATEEWNDMADAAERLLEHPLYNAHPALRLTNFADRRQARIDTLADIAVEGTREDNILPQTTHAYIKAMVGRYAPRLGEIAGKVDWLWDDASTREDGMSQEELFERRLMLLDDIRVEQELARKQGSRRAIVGTVLSGLVGLPITLLGHFQSGHSEAPVDPQSVFPLWMQHLYQKPSMMFASAAVSVAGIGWMAGSAYAKNRNYQAVLAKFESDLIKGDPLLDEGRITSG